MFMIFSQASCQSCMEEREVEIFRHCSARARLKLKHLDSLTIAEPVNVEKTGISKLMIGSKRVLGNITDRRSKLT